MISMDDPSLQPPAAHPVAEESKETAFIRDRFREFYLHHSVRVPFTAMREFGFGYEKKIDLRHKAFNSQKELQEYFTSRVPFYASYSAAYYEYPDARPMPKKNFLKAELVFDLDADTSHEGHNQVVCRACLDAVKADISRLLEDFLFPDFGFTKDEVAVNFSGSKGYHVHVGSDKTVELSSHQRGQLVDYVAAASIDFERFFSTHVHVNDGRRVESLSGPDKGSLGWARRLFRAARALFSLPPEELVLRLKVMGYARKEAEKISSNSAYLLAQLEEGRWSAIRQPEILLEAIARDAAVGSKVVLDRSVTTDMARLIRIPDTLHGDTGLVAKTVSGLDAFEPTKDALAFPSKELVRVIPLLDCAFDFGGESYALQKERLFELPVGAAVLLLCKRKGLLL
jgi:DNA primase small subunit